MAEFKAPQSSRRCNGDRKRSAFRDDRPAERESNSRARKNYKPTAPGTRSRNSSCNSSNSTSDERYRNEGHLGALRSPLRTDNDRLSRRQRDSRGGAGVETRSGRRRPSGHAADTNSRRREGSTRSAMKQEVNANWEPNSVADFPPLTEMNTSSTDWGTRVEEEERMQSCSVWMKPFTFIKAEVVPPKPAKVTAPQAIEENNPKASKKETEPSSPKRLFTKAELKVPEVKAMLARRQKQIDYGKNMTCYANYSKDVPREKRKRNVHPSTPDKMMNYSRRGWDMLIKIWKKKLHHWESADSQNSAAAALSELDSSSYVGSDIDVTLDELVDDDLEEVYVEVNGENDGLDGGNPDADGETPKVNVEIPNPDKCESELSDLKER